MSADEGERVLGKVENVRTDVMFMGFLFIAVE